MAVATLTRIVEWLHERRDWFWPSDDWLEFSFLGEPAPQGSHIATSSGYMRQASKKTMPWRYTVQRQLDQQYKGPVIEGPVQLDVTFVMPRAKGHFSKAKGKTHTLLPSAPLEHTIAPDVDKLLRALLDALQVRCGGNLLRDDSQVCRLSMEKRYAGMHEPSQALVRLRHVR